MTITYYAYLQGGEGPDVWGREIEISAADFMDAAAQADDRAAELGGQVTELTQDYRTCNSAIRDALVEFVKLLDPCDGFPDSVSVLMKLNAVHSKARECLGDYYA